MAKKPDNQDSSGQTVYATRLAKLAELRGRGIDPYPASTKRTHTITEALADFKKLQAKQSKVFLAGRVMSFRQHGKISFANLQDDSGQIQLAFQQDKLGKAYAEVPDHIDIGDFLSAAGTLFQTKKGERTLAISSYHLLAKSLRPLPEKWHGLKDAEERYRKRYLDMLANPEVKGKLRVRARLVKAIRDFLDDHGFIEIENPVLEVAASGAAARPMKTHLDAYGLDLYLRICIGELWQKRSLIGGFEKVFEIGRAFRNEGVDYAHNPDFTMLEYYWAYADYQANMKFHEQLLPTVVKRTTGSHKVDFNGQTIDFKPPYKRIRFRDAIKQASGIDLASHPDEPALRKAMRQAGYEVAKGESYRGLLDGLFNDSFRKQATQPVFVTDYPAVLKPLAKKSADNPSTVQNFQLVAAGMELSNSYSEINDPVDQRERFAQQAKLKRAGDPEAMPKDDDFVEALEYGMPPATGTGIGIDRLAALLTDSHTLREVTAYPLMKPKESDV